MSLSEELSDKKRALLAIKNKLLNDVHYCQKRIEETRKNHAQTYYDDEDSSDSDTGFTVPVKRGPTSQQLRAETSQLNLCLQATQELTSLQVLESEVNVLVDPPKLKNGKYPEEAGTWKEALAECKVDLIPYCVTFYIFQPSKRFGSPTYYQLRVTPTKSGHERELANSVLSKLARPSDAWQVLKSYSVASRSRRSTMARLCDKFGDAIVVGAAEDGGFTIKCANLLEISWSLQNIWSPVMPFQHKTKFDLEYMDEHYIKTIKHAHKQLSDPSLETDERTSLLTNILNTCIEASGNISSVTESETDQSVNLTPVKRRTTLEEEPVIPVKKRASNKVNAESVMPPPKGVPKKTKTKDKENVNLNSNGLELHENMRSYKNKTVPKNSLNKEGSSRNKHDDYHRNSLKPNEKGGSKDNTESNKDHDKMKTNIVTDNKGNEKIKTKEVAKGSIVSNNLKTSNELIVATKSKADKPVKDTEVDSKTATENKQKKNSQTKEINAKLDNDTNKKTSVTKRNDNAERPNENRKKTSANLVAENEDRPTRNENREKTNEIRHKENENSENTNDKRQKTNENRPKTNENRQKTNEKQPKHSQPTTKEDRQKANDNRQKSTENKTQKEKNVDRINEDRPKQNDIRQKQPETIQKPNDNRQKTNENKRKPNETEKQNDKGKNDKSKGDQTKNDNKHDKLKTVESKIPKLFKDNFKPQNFNSKRLSGRIEKSKNDKEKNYSNFEKKPTKRDTLSQSEKNNVNVKKNDKLSTQNDKLTKQNDKFGLKSDKYRLISRNKLLPSSSSGNLKKIR